MEEAGNMLLADIMLWLMYIVLGLAVIVTVVSAVRSFWIENHK